MTDPELYKELGALTKNRSEWEKNIPYVTSLLASGSTKIKAKALWLLGETGLMHPLAIRGSIPVIASFLGSEEPLLRQRAINALGRIGRGDHRLIEQYLDGLFRFAYDQDAAVRLSFIWASENIATNTPELYNDKMQVFAQLLRDSSDKVRMEAPEMFRVVGKRRPEFVTPYIGLLRAVSESDSNRVVRLHCLGAIKAALSGQEG